MIFVAKSSPERTWVPRRVTDRLMVRRLVNINPGRPRTSSTAAPRNPSTTVFGHQEVNPRSPPSSSKRMTLSDPSRKRGRERGGVAAPARRAWGGAAAPARGGEVAEAAPTQGVAAPSCSNGRFWGCLLFSEDALQGLAESWIGGLSSRGPTTHWSTADDREGLRREGQCLGWVAGERSGPPVYDDDDGGLDVSSSGSDSDGGAPPAATTST
jgi:hypothetical protein